MIKFFYFVHSNFAKKLFVNLDFSKKFELAEMIYHVKNSANWNDKKYSSRKSIEFILFFNRLLIDVEIKYWSIELKLIDIVWILKKIRHLVDFFEQRSIVIFTNHDATLKLTKQTNLTIVFIDKFNLRLIKAFDYIQRFEIELRHKSNKQHIVSDVLSRLININTNTISEKNELNALFTIAFVKMKEDFRQKFVVDYNIDLNWKKIFSMFDQQNKNDVNVVKFSFYRENELIFRSDDYIIDNHVYEFHRLCISQSTIQNIFVVAHDDNHSNFARCYDKIAIFYYIRDLFKYLKNFLKHCFKCQTYQTRRHKFYNSLQSIFISNIFFHTIIIDFILILFKSRVDQFDCVMSISCKYFKRIMLISNKNTWTIAQWNHVLLDRLNIIDWKLFKIIISNRDRKFLSNMWIVMFIKLEIKLLYSTVYHSQTNDLFERINQIVEIALRFLIFTLKYFDFWLEILSHVQRDFNNSINVDNFSNEIVYDFISVQIIDLTKSIFISKLVRLTLKKRRFIIRQNVNDAIAFVQMNAKFHYDKKHESMFMKQKNVTLIKLHKNYSIFSTISKKYDQQFVEFFTIIEKIDRLTYRLNISSNWFIHSIFNVTQLKKCSSFSVDFFKRSKSNHFDFVFVNDDTINVKFFELSRIINKRMIKKRNVEYFVEWKNYESKHDVWRNFSKFENAMNLVKKYELIMNQNILSNRLVLSSELTSSSSSISSFSTSSSIRSTRSATKKSILKKSFEFFKFSTIFTILIRKSFTNFSIKIFFEQKFVVIISFKVLIVDVSFNALIRRS